MKKYRIISISLLFVFILLMMGFKNQNTKPRPVKNLIILIPDGCSISVLELQRLFKKSMGQEPSVSFDSIICGLMKTSTASEPIGESAANITAMMCGVKTKAKSLGVDENNNSIPSVFELAKTKGMATGIVGTCEFPNATTTASVAHTNNRKAYNTIIKQMVANLPDVVFAGGGEGYINSEFSENVQTNMKRKDKLNLEDSLKAHNCRLVHTKSAFDKINTHKFQKIWCLFNTDTVYLPNHFDNDTTLLPSLAQMTDKAINILKNNSEGFILLVEGSKVDWMSHNNDVLGVISEFTGFEEAVDVALKFARKDMNTAVIVCPDHGNGGLSIGNIKSNETIGYQSFVDTKYDKLSFHQFDSITFRNLRYPNKKIATGEGFRAILKTKVDSVLKANNAVSLEALKPDKYVPLAKFIIDYYNVDFTPLEIDQLLFCVKSNKEDFDKVFGPIYSRHTYIGFNTNGHTGEDVFFAIYHPKNDVLAGVIDNTQIAHYISDVLDLGLLAP